MMPQPTKRAERLLDPNELALPAICGQTGKLFVLVAERRSRTLLEILRAVPIEGEPSSASVLVVRSEKQLQTRSRLPTHALPSIPHDRNTLFQQRAMSAAIEIGGRYDGCPYCRARGYFRCGNCELFSCWTKYNSRLHGDHDDVWCAGCRSWRCTSDDGPPDSLTDLTAYQIGSVAIERRKRSRSDFTSQNYIDCGTSVVAYLE
jgi:hypothetical protein